MGLYKHTAGRRQFVLGSLALVGGLLLPLRSRAQSGWPNELFSLTKYEHALNALLQGAKPIPHTMLTVPGIAENGAKVRVAVDVLIPNVTKISLLVEKNPVPLISQFIITEYSLPTISINLKMHTTSNVVALAESDGKFYIDTAEVRIISGGCA